MLKQWIEKSHMTQLEFAALVGLSHKFHLNRIINLHKIPSRHLALKIQEVTNGEVTAMDVLYPKRIKT